MRLLPLLPVLTLTSICIGAGAMDLARLRGGGMSGLPDLSSIRSGLDGTEPMYDLSADLTPFVGDSPLADSLYIIGPGDFFQIFYESSSMEKQVNPEGNIILSRIGVISLEGLTLQAAKKLLVEKLQTAHKRNECFVNLSKPKTMKVFVTGAVNLPGTYQVNGNFRLMDVLNAAQGFSALAQRGDIRIVSRHGDTQSVNIRKFLVDGNLAGNPFLPQGGFVHVPFIDYAKPLVTVRRDTGSLEIQLDAGESAGDLMLKYQSFRTLPPFSAVLIKKNGGGGKVSFVTPSEIWSFHPVAKDTLEIIQLNREIFVGGAVMRPGFQPYRSNRKLVHYISEAGLLTSSRVATTVTVVHADGKREDMSLREGRLIPGDMVYVDQNTEQRFIIYTPILLSLASLSLAIINIFYFR